MKFDAVVGNPPYQEVSNDSDNETFAAPVYQEFLKVTFKLGTKVSLIHPARFLFNAGATSKDFNRDFLNNKHVKIICYTQNSNDFFPNTDIKGGVAITYYDPEENFGAIRVFTPFAELNSIYKKVVLNNKDFSPFSKIVCSRKIYKLTEKFYKENPSAPTYLKDSNNYTIGTNAFDKMAEYFFDEKPNDGAEYVQILGRVGVNRIFKWIRRDYVVETKNLEHYKVFIPSSNGSGMIGEKLVTPLVGLPLVGLPLVGSPETFTAIGDYLTEAEAVNCLKYVKTKFARALLGVLKVTQHNPPATWACVPLQDFTNDSDIDWSRSVAEIDAQLYKKYNLAQDEINFIEEKVTAME